MYDCFCVSLRLYRLNSAIIHNEEKSIYHIYGPHGAGAGLHTY